MVVVLKRVLVVVAMVVVVDDALVVTGRVVVDGAVVVVVLAGVVLVELSPVCAGLQPPATSAATRMATKALPTWLRPLSMSETMPVRRTRNQGLRS